MLTRRTVCSGIAALPLIGAGPAGFPDETAWASLDKRTGRVSGERADQRMPMCSSFKWLLAARVLSRVDRGAERLDRLVRFGPGDMLDASPVTKAALGGKAEVSLTVAALCAATVGTSDNAAANLLLPSVGGPAGLTRWLRSIGDPVTRLDRTEPELNRVLPGDPRDTTTPAAMLRDLDRLLYGPVLQSASRERLMAWMLATTTGPTRLRAGLPAGWRIAHKTGTFDGEANERSASGDVGALLPPRGAPVLVAAYTTGFHARQAEADRWFAGLARRLSTSSPRP